MCTAPNNLAQNGIVVVLNIYEQFDLKIRDKTKNHKY